LSFVKIKRTICGAFAIEREETTGKNKKNELKPNLDVFQPKKHIRHIKVNLVFPGSFPLSTAKAKLR